MRSAWDFSRNGVKPTGSTSLTKAINVRYPVGDWKLIRKAAAEEGVSMTVWLMRAAERSVEELRQNAARTEPK